MPKHRFWPEEPLPAAPSQPSNRRKKLALAVAGLADLAQLAFLPLFAEGFASPAEDVLDLCTAVALTAILGFRWRLAAAFVAELIPGADLFPSWTAAVLSLRAELEDAPVTTVPPLQRGQES